MTQTVDALFDEGIERYKAGESAETLIPVFKEVCNRAPKSGAAWTCLSWLYLLDDKPNSALKAAQKAVKLNGQDPQARVNLAIAMLEVGKPGVRQHVDIATQVVMAVEELRTEVQQSLEDGLQRRPDWASLQRVKSWIFG
jgi:predicted Zn-dependent protease